MTPAEANQERRDAAILRGRRIDAIDPGQLLNVIHRLAAIAPADVDRVLAEFDANAPKPRTEKPLHPVGVYVADDVTERLTDHALVLECGICPDWHEHLDDGQPVAELCRLATEHSGLEQLNGGRS